jgi:hypothetical protein
MRSDILIEKLRGTAGIIVTLAILLSRLPKNHPKYEQIRNDFEKRKAGEYGEDSLDYFLSLIHGTDFKILHNIRLSFKDYYFQIDTLLLFPSFFIILEVKNLTGTLLFDPNHHQLIQIRTDESGKQVEKAMTEPILQVKRQYSQFREWLSGINVPPIPGEMLVVLTNPNAIVKSLSNPQLIQEMVVKNNALSFRIEKLIGKHSTSGWSKKEMRKVINSLLKHNSPLEINPLDYYGISISELLTGVRCPKCSELAMERWNARWKCHHCKHTCKKAHINALNDFALLIRKIASIKELCDFLHIADPVRARRLLAPMNLSTRGKNRYLKYILP